MIISVNTTRIITLLLVFLGFAAEAQIPVITYTTPQTYTAGVTISPLVPSNSGGSAGSYGAVSTFVNSNGHNAIATDASGNVYILSYDNNSLTVYNSAGTVITTNYPSSGYNGPQAAVLDALGNLYVSNFLGNSVTKTSPAGVVTTIAISSPLGLTVDASNNVYVAGYTTGVIYKIATGTAALSSFLTGFSSPWGVAINPTGDLYVSQVSDNVIYKVANGSTTHTSFATGFNGPRFLALDEKNNLYVSDVYNNVIKKITSGGAISTLISGLNTPDDEVFDPSGNIYISNYGNNNVVKSVASGYSVSPALPAGLNLNKYSGVISGTPTVATAAANYAVTATNGSGNSIAFNINITVNAMPTPSVVVSGNPGCGAGSVTLTGSGGSPSGGSYNWYSSATGNIVATGSTFAPLVSGTYYLSYTTTSGVTSAKSSAAITINPVVSSPLSGAVFSYPFSGNTNDLSGNSNNGIATGSPTLTTDRFGNANSAYLFNGSSQYISCTSISNNPNVFTLSLWFNTTTAGGKLIGFGLAQTGSSGGYDRNIYMTNSGQLYYGIYQSNTVLTINTVGSYNDGNWHHVVVTQGAAGSTLYVDGVVQASSSAMTTGQPYNGYWRIGYDNLYGWTNAPTNYYFTGKLDDIAVYNRVLTSAEITSSNNLNLIGNSSPVCGSNAITLTAPAISGATYSWTDGTTIVTGNPATFAAASTGNYTLTVTGPAGCSSTATVTPGTGQIFTWTGAGSNTDPTNTANWNNTTANATGQAPLFNGTENLVIPNGLSYYPALTANESVYVLTINNGASLNLNGFTLNTACDIHNSLGGQILYGTSTTSGITWNGTVPIQSYYGSTTAGTSQIANMVINNSAAGTVKIVSGALDIYNALTLTKGNLAIGASPVTVTLKSTSTLSASVTAIPTSSAITGTINVERYITGGSLTYRGYRLLSSPVTSGSGVYSINYLKNSIFLTGTTGTSGGFDATGGANNPTLYLYRENLTNPAYTTFLNSNFIGISNINSSPTYSMNDATYSTTTIPVGNGYLCFFRGSRTTVSPFVTTTVPVAATVTATGTLNQGQITANDWFTSSNLSYTTASPTAIRGFNLVGNPYASSIDWDKFSTTAGSPITGTNVSATMYILNPTSKNYRLYTAGSGGTATDGTTSGNIIPSGEGFFVLATAASPALVFNEAAKTTTQPNSLNKLMGVSANYADNQYIRLQLAMDTINTDYALIRFNSNAGTNYDPVADAPYRKGYGLVSLSTISTDNIPLAIYVRKLPKTSASINLAVNANNDGIYSLNLKDIYGIPQLFDIWLMDSYLKDSLDMRHNNTYSFRITKNDTNSFGNKRFSLVIRQNPAYAYRLLSFTAVKADGNASNVQVTWTSENEGNYTHFTVERSNDGGQSYNIIGVVVANDLGKYSVLDKNALPGKNLYRLQQVDINDNTTFSNIVTVEYGYLSNALSKGKIGVYPNPASSTLNITISAGTNNNDSYQINITNSFGLLVRQTKAENATWQGDVSNLLPGTYLIKVINAKDNSIVGDGKFVKL